MLKLLDHDPSCVDRLERPCDIDQETVAAAAHGDPIASRRIVESFRLPIFRILFRMVGGRYREDLDDYVQDLFVKIFRNLQQFDASRARFSTWIYTFVKNYAIDLLKRPRRAIVSLDDGLRPTWDPPAPESTPPHELLDRELSDRIAGAIAMLSEEQRLVFVLREYEGLDYETIAEILGIAVGTVRSRLYRAKEILRRRLQPYLRVEPV
ncbi:MAG: sigma-70 family RNA polymerase sigma factor [Planctomycetota bacterium]